MNISLCLYDSIVKKFLIILSCLSLVPLNSSANFSDDENESFRIISSIAVGSPDIDILSTIEEVENNGDFKIYSNNINSLVGDGLNEITMWWFYIGHESDWLTLTNLSLWRSVELILTLKPGNDRSSDIVRIGDLPDIQIPDFDSLPIGELSTVRLELLDYYSAKDILSVLMSPLSGQIPVLYEDDAIISLAEINFIIYKSTTKEVFINKVYASPNLKFFTIYGNFGTYIDESILEVKIGMLCSKYHLSNPIK